MWKSLLFLIFFEILFTIVFKFDVPNKKLQLTQYSTTFKHFSKARSEHWSERTVTTSQGGSFVYIIYLLCPIDHVVGWLTSANWLEMRLSACARAFAFFLFCCSELNTRQGCNVVDYYSWSRFERQRCLLNTIFLFS